MVQLQKLGEGVVAVIKLLKYRNKDECESGLPAKKNTKAICF